MDVRGRYVATGGSDALVNLWSPHDWIGQRAIPYSEYVGRIVLRPALIILALRLHRSKIVSAAFSSDGEYVASAGEAASFFDVVSYARATLILALGVGLTVIFLPFIRSTSRKRRQASIIRAYHSGVIHEVSHGILPSISWLLRVVRGDRRRGLVFGDRN